MTLKIRRLLVSAADTLFHQNMMKRVGVLREAQWWPRQALERAREERLQDLIRIAYEEVPLYRSIMDERRLTPRDIQTAADLKKLPVLTRDMLRAAFPDRIRRTTGQRTYIASSSGSTGSTVQVAEDRETAGQYRACFLLALEWAGWNIGESHLQTGMTARSIERQMKDWILRCYYVPARDLTEKRLDRVLSLLDRRSIRHVWGYPASLYYLALHAEKRGWKTPLKSVITWGDKLHSPYRSKIESVFRRPVIDNYGCGEGIQIATQCGHGPHYHVFDLDVIVEYVDEAGREVPPHQPGNLVVTRLYPGPTPLIRYAVGDLGVRGVRRSCSCGRTWDLLESIEGRTADTVTTPSGNRLILHFFTGILEHFHNVLCFQVIQTGPSDLRILIKPAERASASLPGEIVNAFRRAGLDDMDIDVRLVGEIPLTSSGKRRFVISEAGFSTGGPQGFGVVSKP